MAIAASKDADFYLKRGRLYADKGELERAAAEYTRAIQLRPDDQRAYRLRAEAHREKGDLDRALADLDKAIDLDMYCAPAFISRGLVYREMGEIEDYEEDFRVAVLLNPELVNDEKYGAEFARILKASQEAKAKWDEAFSRPESDIFLLKMAEEALEEHRQGKTKPLKLEDL